MKTLNIAIISIFITYNSIICTYPFTSKQGRNRDLAMFANYVQVRDLATHITLT